jgi:hypothetical protein
VKKECLNVALIGVVLVLTACSEAPKPAASETKSEPETKRAAEIAGPVSAKTAFWEMYKLAHAWAPDVVPLSMVSKEVPGIKNGAGKAGMWTAAFVSPSLRQARNLSYSVGAAPPNISKGVDVGRPVPWGPTRDAMPFQTSDFAIDSDAAYKTATGYPLDSRCVMECVGYQRRCCRGEPWMSRLSGRWPPPVRRAGRKACLDSWTCGD